MFLLLLRCKFIMSDSDREVGTSLQNAESVFKEILRQGV